MRSLILKIMGKIGWGLMRTGVIDEFVFIEKGRKHGWVFYNSSTHLIIYKRK